MYNEIKFKDMKKIALYSLLILGTVFISGCGDDFLNRVRPLNFTEEIAFSDAAHIEQTVVGLYSNSGLRHNYLLGGRILLVSENVGDDVINDSNNGVELYNTYLMGVGLSTQENMGTWQYAYQAINKCNIFLDVIASNKEAAGSNYDKFVAEAKFIRALTYYFLHQTYTMPYLYTGSGGGPSALSVPLRLQAETEIFENKDLARATSQEVLDQILSDLSSASALPVGNGKEETVARASQAAAAALKMRVYMIMGQWQNAIDAGKSITGYSLVSDITSLYKAPYITSEAIFSAAFADNNRGSSQSHVAYYYNNGKSDKMEVVSGIFSIEGYKIANDPRIGTLTNINTAAAGKEYLLKYPDATTYTDWIPVFRYAEILLNLAECYANLGNDAEALNYLKQVRTRSVKAEDEVLNLDALKGDALKQAIYNEARLEFIGEGHRGFDIRRRAETITKQGNTARPLVFPPSTGTANYIWPIPYSELAQNDAITN
jgi:tetratricopeptide (TPR) repeat protein